MYINVTMILPADLAPLARSLAAHLAGPPGDGMWLTGLSPDGTEPATHYVSSGPVGVEFEAALTDANVLWAAVQAAEADVSREQVDALVAAAEVVDLAEESPFDTFDRLGLQMAEENHEA